MILDMNDFPDSFVDYKKRIWNRISGKETISGAETFKKINKRACFCWWYKRRKIYFFEPEYFVSIAIQSEIEPGLAKRMMAEATMSDYDEVDGLYFPFAMTQGIKGQPGGPIAISKIELSPTVDEKEICFPKNFAKK